MVFQEELQLKAYPRGFHLITDQIVPLIRASGVSSGIAHIFIKHTSASLTINENADPTVRSDFEQQMNAMVPENQPFFKHTFEGSDDMPAHVKSSLMGSSVSVPVNNGQMMLGTWQGIYLGEHRDYGGSRRIVVTIVGN